MPSERFVLIFISLSIMFGGEIHQLYRMRYPIVVAVAEMLNQANRRRRHVAENRVAISRRIVAKGRRSDLSVITRRE